jgi:hypothetical protein
MMGMETAQGVLIPNGGILVMWDVLVASTSVIRMWELKLRVSQFKDSTCFLDSWCHLDGTREF